MEPFRRILIGLDCTERDSIVIQNIALMSRFKAIHKIYFAHILDESDIPREIISKYPNCQTPDTKGMEECMNERINKYFPDINKYNHDLIIKEGDRTETMLKIIRDNDIDFLALGRNVRPGITFLSRKIGHLAPCSIGFFPLLIKEKFRRVVVPVDFSDISIEALKRAFFYQKNDPDIEVYPVHFYDVPVGYYKIGKTYEEFSEIMYSNAEKKFKEVFDKIPDKPSKIEYDIFIDKDDNVTSNIFDYSLRKSADLVVMGSRGRTHFASFILGSVAIKLVESLYHIPILIEKDKKKLMGITDIMLQ